MKLCSILNSFHNTDSKDAVLAKFPCVKGHDVEPTAWPTGTSSPYHALVEDGPDIHELTFRFGDDDKLKFVELASTARSPEEATTVARLLAIGLVVKLGRGASKRLRRPKVGKPLFGRSWLTPEHFKREIVAEHGPDQPDTAPAYVFQRVYFR